jgi:tetratricopeptide (TPR) repeat protein
MLGKLDEAIACYDKALQIDPRDSVFLNNKANALYKKGNIKEALEIYELAFKLNPESKSVKKGIEI